MSLKFHFVNANKRSRFYKQSDKGPAFVPHAKGNAAGARRKRALAARRASNMAEEIK